MKYKNRSHKTCGLRLEYATNDRPCCFKKAKKPSRLKRYSLSYDYRRSRKRYVLEAVHAGVSGYIVKPFNQTTFAEKLEIIYTKIS